MRELLNGVFTFIGAESLTDEEWDILDALDLSSAYDNAAYKALDQTLKDREAVSTMRDKLKAYYTAKGVAVTADETKLSNIFVGGAL